MTLDTDGRPIILLVEDDAPLAEMLRYRLRARGYAVLHAQSAAEAEAAAIDAHPALIILDLMLPDMHGLILCANLKERCAAPIIICSATKRKDDGALGLKLGADDFIAKPFSSDELEARIALALGRSARGAAAPALGDEVQTIGTLSIDRARCVVAVGDMPVHLTPTEYRLLCALADQPDRVVPAKALVERVWAEHDAGLHDALGVHVRRLRAKLTGGPVRAPTIVAARGFGYRLTCEGHDGGATGA